MIGRPEYNTIVYDEDKAIFVGKHEILPVIRHWIDGYQIVRWWVGTDVLLLHKFPPGRGKLSVLAHRLKSKLIGLFVHCEWANGEHLVAELKSLGIQAIDIRWIGVFEKWEKIPPEYPRGWFTIAYYHPRDDVFSRWVYGIDIIEDLKKLFMFSYFRWIRLDGTKIMKEVMPEVDLYLRPNRHDGYSHIVQECEYNGIPVIWTWEEKSTSYFRRFVEAYAENHFKLRGKMVELAVSMEKNLFKVV